MNGPRDDEALGVRAPKTMTRRIKAGPEIDGIPGPWGELREVSLQHSLRPATKNVKITDGGFRTCQCLVRSEVFQSLSGCPVGDGVRVLDRLSPKGPGQATVQKHASGTLIEGAVLPLSHAILRRRVGGALLVDDAFCLQDST